MGTQNTSLSSEKTSKEGKRIFDTSQNFITTEQITDWMLCFHKNVKDQEKYLTELDAAIGDADHGANLVRGVEQIVRHIEEFKNADIRAQFRAISLYLTNSVGGASGPLYGTFFLQASQVTPTKQKLKMSDMALSFEAGVNGVMNLGHAQPGDKTMVDVLVRVAELYQSISHKKNIVVDVVKKGVDVAKLAMESTIPMKALKGRASYLGERSVGHQDPGATSSYLLFLSLLEAVTPKQSPLNTENTNPQPLENRE